MKLLRSAFLLLLGLFAGLTAHAQSCGRGGGATVCLTASGSPDSIQLAWTVSGSVTGLQVFRSTSANPNTRARIATVSASTRSYNDTAALVGTQYWYWVRFATRAGAYNSGSATASRGAVCAPTTVTPYVTVDGARTQTASAVVAAGTPVTFAPEPASGGSWAWSGCGTSGSARQQTVTPSASCSATVVHTNACGAKTTQQFTVTVPGLMRDLSSLQLSKLMAPGINLGNTLEALPTETSWGQPMTTQAIMNGYKAAGFKSVRIPVAWKVHSDADHNIDPAWMDRVKQVVEYARNAGLYVVVNTHWDNGWANHPTYAAQAEVNAQITKFWTQIANAFKHHDDHLLFAGLNEVMFEGDWGPPTAEYCTVHNSFNQTFVDAVRATGGNNATRHLVVQAFNTNIDAAMRCPALVPSDSAANRLFMEVHYYDPFNFTLNTNSTIWQWGSIATDPSATETWANEPWVDAQFQKMKSAYVDSGVPVIVGEYGAYPKSAYPDMAAYIEYWAQYVTRSSVQHGLVPMWWDTGELFDRVTGAQKQPGLVGKIVGAAAD